MRLRKIFDEFPLFAKTFIFRNFFSATCLLMSSNLFLTLLLKLAVYVPFSFVSQSAEIREKNSTSFLQRDPKMVKT